jgi:hypothetical protein
MVSIAAIDSELDICNKQLLILYAESQDSSKFKRPMDFSKTMFKMSEILDIMQKNVTVFLFGSVRIVLKTLYHAVHEASNSIKTHDLADERHWKRIMGVVDNVRSTAEALHATFNDGASEPGRSRTLSLPPPIKRILQAFVSGLAYDWSAPSQLFDKEPRNQFLMEMMQRIGNHLESNVAHGDFETYVANGNLLLGQLILLLKGS